jgi:hypothetical protein
MEVLENSINHQAKLKDKFIPLSRHPDYTVFFCCLRRDEGREEELNK